MGTRSLTIVQDEQGRDILNMYRQMDGYPSGHGAELVAFLKDIRIVNGISPGNKERIANGMGCLAAQLVAHFKTDVGGFYLHHPNERNLDEEYIYTVKLRNGKIVVDVFDVYDKTSFNLMGDSKVNKEKVEMVPVDSSSVAAIGYDGVDLFVEFLNGSTYKYIDVPADEVEGLYTADSVGSTLNTEIKPFYTYEKVS